MAATGLTNTVSNGPTFEGSTHELYQEILKVIRETEKYPLKTLERIEGAIFIMELGALYVQRKINRNKKGGVTNLRKKLLRKSVANLRKQLLNKSIELMSSAIEITVSTPDHIARLRDCHHKLMNYFE